jgi:hypothetical protein
MRGTGTATENLKKQSLFIVPQFPETTAGNGEEERIGRCDVGMLAS